MSKYKTSFAMFLAMLFWALGWPALKITTQYAGFEVVTFWRFVIMFLAFLPVVWFVRAPFVLSKKALLVVFVNSLLNVLFMATAFAAVYFGSAGGGGVMITTLSPIITFVLTYWLFKTTLYKQHIVGLFIGALAGLVMLGIFDKSVEVFTFANLFYILAALIWALISIMGQQAHTHMHPIYYSFIISLIGTLVMLVLAYPKGIGVVFDFDMRFWMAMIFLGVLGQMVATTIYYIVSGHIGAQKSSAYMFMVPFFAFVFSMLFLGESFKLHIALGGVLAIVAVVLISRR